MQMVGGGGSEDSREPVVSYIEGGNKRESRCNGAVVPSLEVCGSRQGWRPKGFVSDKVGGGTNGRISWGGKCRFSPAWSRGKPPQEGMGGGTGRRVGNDLGGADGIVMLNECSGQTVSRGGA